MLGLALVLSSCMHFGMMGNHAGEDVGSHNPPESRLEKEVTAGDVKATAIFPPLQVSKEILFTLKLYDVRNRRAISEAKASFHAEYVHKAGTDEHAMHGGQDAIPNRPPADHAVSFERELEESSETGTYAVAFTASQAGEYHFMFHISAIGEQEIDPEIVIDVQRTAIPAQQHSSGMMRGMGAASTYVIIGGALMGAMMLAVWISGGRMF